MSRATSGGGKARTSSLTTACATGQVQKTWEQRAEARVTKAGTIYCPCPVVLSCLQLLVGESSTLGLLTLASP